MRRAPLRGPRRPRRRESGFTLIEVLVALFVVSTAIIGLAQMFTVSVLQNRRANDLSNATFLVQQEIDDVRTLTLGEMNARAGVADEMLDLNADGTDDYRRLSRLQFVAPTWEIRVLVFPAFQSAIAQDDLLAEPIRYKALADISTIISR